MTSNDTEIHARSLDGRPISEWELLKDHLRVVAERAAGFAAPFGGENAAHLLGAIHDLGKVKARFQAKLHGTNNGEPHSNEGARWLYTRYGAPFAACVAGHHSGLLDAADLRERMLNTNEVPVPDWLDLPDPATFVPSGPLAGQQSPFAIQFAFRMLFSCLVDADELESAAFVDTALGRPVTRIPDIVTEAHRAAFDVHMAGMADRSGDLNALRRTILSTVRERAAQAPGLFSMTVPTGGGKTLASLGFALDHARAHGMARIIHVIPYTSIVEQTAEVFRDVLGSEAVVEHHSTFDWEKLNDDEEVRLRRVTRNWDAPVVVTTAVQFFESLFAARKRRCAKLHNLSRAVIVIDEAQTMPRALLRPCLAAIRELTTQYGASVVLSTATQPVLTRERGLDVPEAMETAVELAPDPPELYRRLRRTTVRDGGEMEDETLAARIAAEPGILVIVGNRKHARSLFERVRGLPGAAHLTTTMTPAHRRHVLAELRGRLKQGEPVRLVATSLVEAGVDLDFPKVMRAAAGLDSIAQAAGRCNREGKLPEKGEVTVFTPVSEGAGAPEEVEFLAGVARKVIAAHPDDPLSLEAVAEYFGRVLHQQGPEALDTAKVGEGASVKGIMRAIEADGQAIRYDAIARAFEMIDDGQAPVIVRGGRWGIPDDELSVLEWRTGTGGIARALQPYVVTVPHRIRREMETARAASVWREDLFGREFLLLDSADVYDDEAGMRMEEFEDMGTIIG